MKKRIIVILLAFLLVSVGWPLSVYAEETYGYEVEISPNPVAIGEEVTLTIRLTDYTEAKSPLRGFQIDITDVDDVLHNAVCTSLAADKENLISDVAKYQPSRDIVRHLYAKMNGTMSYSVEDLLEVKFYIPESYTEAGTLSLPMKILMQNAAGDELTYRDTIDITYGPKGELPDPPDKDTVQVEVSWGNMDFTYTKGLWNPVTHSYENPGWTDNGSGYVIVKNTGETDTAVSFSYNLVDNNVAGEFDMTGEMPLVKGGELTAKLKLSGTPSREMNAETVGTATVRIGGE